MALELQDTVKHLNRSGETDFQLAEGKSLVIETTPGGSELLSQQVPAGKQWHVWITVTVEETDV